MLISVLGSDPVLFILIVISLVFALCIHEFSHGYIAYLNGDDTAYRMGRLTLNPLKHLDPIGSMMILFIGFGYAKPVPVNPNNLDNPRKDIIKVAAAGPISNFILAFGGILLCTFFIKIGSFPDSFFENLISYRIFNNNYAIFLFFFIRINIYLGLFNLLPIYPLDGGQIFGNLIAKYDRNIFIKLNEYGPKVLLGIIVFSMLSGISIFTYILDVPLKFIVNGFMLISDLLLFFL